MEDMESKLGAILSNPQMMQQIMSIAQNFQSDPEPAPTQNDSMPELDLHMVQKLTALIGKTGIDTHQKALLQALNPYLNTGRIQKLEKAMRAAKLASMATVVFGNLGR